MTILGAVIITACYRRPASDCMRPEPHDVVGLAEAASKTVWVCAQARSLRAFQARTEAKANSHAEEPSRPATVCRSAKAGSRQASIAFRK